VALALVFLGHEEQGVLQMGGSGKIFISCFLIVPLHVARAKVAVITMISWFPPDHWDPKTKRFFLSFGPLPQFFNTNRPHLMRSPWFTLISKFHAKVCVVDYFTNSVMFLCCF
jgi:hypothetical protein